MNFGLVGWGIASGNGGMNQDIVRLASWVTHWLVPEHPKSKNHSEYVDNLLGKKIIHCKLTGDDAVYDKFLDEIDGLLYIEHPCIRDEYDIVLSAKKKGKLVVGIPMWEWWPERKPWAMATDILLAVTSFTNSYLVSLSNVLYTHGWQHSWRGNVIECKWGVNLDDFKFAARSYASRFVFINGNGGYKMRKASDVVFEAFSLPGSPELVVYSQGENISSKFSSNIKLINKNFPSRHEVYADGDVFLFPSYWEGLCHGIYEGQAVGGLIVTTDHPPMSECGSDYLVPVSKVLQEDLSGKKIIKAVASSKYLHEITKSLYGKDISKVSANGRRRIEESYDLKTNLNYIYNLILNQFHSCKVGKL